jgi:hypothetical protein
MIIVVTEIRIGVTSLSSFAASLGYLHVVFVIGVSRAEVFGDPYFDDGALAFTAEVVFLSLSFKGNTASVMSSIM